MPHETSQLATPTTATAADASLLTVDGPLTIAVAEAWRARLVAALAGEGELTVDLSAATEIDVFGVQLLLAARRSAAEQGRSFRVADNGESLARACVSAGVDRALF
jgi:anti-anti-sigma regulatory factor